MSDRLKGLWSDHPGTDWMPIIAATAALAYGVIALGIPDSEGVPAAFLGAVAGIAGLAFAAATFVCTMTYQSTNYLMSGLRKSHHRQIRRNWISILSSLLLSGIAAAFGTLTVSWAPNAAATLGIFCATVVLVRSFRALWWLRQTLFIEDVAFEKPERMGYDRTLLERKF